MYKQQPHITINLSHFYLNLSTSVPTSRSCLTRNLSQTVLSFNLSSHQSSTISLSSHMAAPSISSSVDLSLSRPVLRIAILLHGDNPPWCTRSSMWDA